MSGRLVATITADKFFRFMHKRQMKTITDLVQLFHKYTKENTCVAAEAETSASADSEEQSEVEEKRVHEEGHESSQNDTIEAAALEENESYACEQSATSDVDSSVKEKDVCDKASSAETIIEEQLADLQRLSYRPAICEAKTLSIHFFYYHDKKKDVALCRIICEALRFFLRQNVRHCLAAD